MTYYVTLLRTLATCLITNSHYEGIYPYDILANGGLLGDIIFFTVSGYCLNNVKERFSKWYVKRVIRCYVPVVIITLLYFILGYYYTSVEKNIIYWFVFPTNYHFIASIMLLYVPYYFVVRYKCLKDRIPLIMLIVFVTYILVYILFFDKTYYHIDNVWENMVKFLYFESMLLGAYIRSNTNLFHRETKIKDLILVVIVGAAYLVSKILLVKNIIPCNLQIINQIFIYFFLYSIFALFATFEEKLKNLPRSLMKIITFVASMTLEIYLVQYVLIDVHKNLAPFPFNWIIVSCSIFIVAIALHYLTAGLTKVILKLFSQY